WRSRDRRHRRWPARELNVAQPSGHLATHPLPPGIVGALGLGGYQLLADVAGVGVGRLGRQGFLLVAPDPDPALPDAGTQISLHPVRHPSWTAQKWCEMSCSQWRCGTRL